MQTEYWKKLEEIFARAIVLPAGERAAFAREKSGGDENLLRDAARLLELDGQENLRLDTPVFAVGTKILATEPGDYFSPGEQFKSFRLHLKIGRGGMGFVYLAEDLRLQRSVALKFLPAHLADDPATVQRFQQEARAASNVSHPNVAHIYEFGQHEGRYFLAMEYVPGRTLRELIESGEIRTEKAIEIALQIASALQAAHKNGIVHRDIKPENVVVMDDGLVKVLDFGLAKLAFENENSASGFYQDSLETSPGLILGTTAYMAPEQIRGRQLDGRADLWSLGVCFYEMLTGERPFTGETASDVQAAILKDEPSFDKIESSPEIKRILHKALGKAVESRYQTAGGLAADLAILKQNYDFSEAASGELLLKAKSDGQKSSPTNGAANYNRQTSILAVILLLALAGVSWIIFKGNVANVAVNSVRRADKLTHSGRGIVAALSPDGKKLAYVLEESGQRNIYLTDRTGNFEFSSNRKALLARPLANLHGLTFTPDGEHLFFRHRATGEAVGSFYRISTARDAAQEPQKIIANVYGAPSFSPDGRQFVFLRLSADNSREELIVADADGANEKVLYARRRPEFIPDEARPAWSPDAKTIICAAGVYREKTQHIIPVAINAADGAASPVFNEPWEQIWATEWLGDGKAFLMTGRRDCVYENNPIWRVEYPSGAIVRLTNDYNDYYTISAPRAVDPANNQIVSVILKRTAHLSKAELKRPAETTVQLTSGEGDNGFGVSWRQPGKIVYGALTLGNADIWEIDETGGERRQLTASEYLDSQPAMTSDGRFIVFGSERSGSESLWRINADGGDPLLLASNIYRDSVALAPDGKFVYYRSDFEGGNALWRVSIENPRPEKLAAGNFRSAAISPDGRWLAATLAAGEPNETEQLALMTIENPSQPVRRFPLENGALLEEKIRFSPDGKSVVYIVVKKGVGNLWAQPVDGGAPQQITKFTDNRLYSFDWSPDGQQFVCARGELVGSITLLTLEAR